MHALLALLLPLLMTAPASPETPAAPMQALEPLIGEWDGSGWIVLGPQGKATFNQHESVRRAAGGGVVVIDGLGKATSAAEGAEPKIVHQAFAVISYDTKAKAYRWRAYRANGDEIDTTAEIADGKIVWGFDDPRGGKIRFTINVANGEWHEVGDFVTAGKPMRFFEMTLRRR